MDDTARAAPDPAAAVHRAAASPVYEYDADRGAAAKFADGLLDLRQGLAMAPVWLALGWWDFRRQTRRTALGPLWSILGTGLQVAVLGYVFGALLDADGGRTFPYIAGGLMIWFFISGCINGGLSVYVSAKGVLSERTLPVAFSAFRFVFRYFVEMILKLAVFFGAAAYASLSITSTALLAIPGMLLLAATGMWVVLLLGPVGARFRDVQQLVSPLMLMAFLASPVIWESSRLGDSAFIATINPFTHFLAIVRDPLMGSAPPILSVMVCLGMLIVGWLAAVVSHSFTKDRVVYWI